MSFWYLGGYILSSKHTSPSTCSHGLKTTVLSKYHVISVYNTCKLLSNNENYVDANLDAPDKAISGNEPSSEML